MTRGGTVARAAAPPREAGSNSQAEDGPSASEQSDIGVSRIDAAAVAQRTLGVPIGEVVRNHHERLALLEEKVGLLIDYKLKNPDRNRF